MQEEVKLASFAWRLVARARAVLDGARAAGEPVVVAVSGGSDSMALLEIAGLLAPELRLGLHVACIDHGVRAEAAGEIELVRAAALRWGADFHACRIDPGRGDEDSMRRARHARLREIARESGARFILLGHTSDDQIETMLFRFLRGAGPGGLAGMRPIHGSLLRPLLAAKREDLRRFLRDRGVAWAEDATNVSERYARGRLRTKVLPAVEQAFGRGALEHLLDVSPLWRRDEEYLEQEAARHLAYVSRRGQRGVELDAGALANVPVALLSRLLRRWLKQATGRTPGSREIAAIERWIGARPPRPATPTRGTLDVPGATLLQRNGRLVLQPAGDRSAKTAKTMLPPARGRVSFARAQDFSRENPQRCNK